MAVAEGPGAHNAPSCAAHGGVAGDGEPAGSPPTRDGAAGNGDANSTEAADESPLVGRWQYGSRHFGRPTAYGVRRSPSGRLRFEGPRPNSGRVSGALEPADGGWLQARLRTEAGEPSGSIRLRPLEEGGVLSNFRVEGREQWGKDIVAQKAPDGVQGEAAGEEEELLGPTGIQTLPGLVRVPPEAARLISVFAKRRRGTSHVEEITGGRHEVFLEGHRSEHFQTFLRSFPDQNYAGAMWHFLAELRETLLEVARASKGELSKDIVALVGGKHMQVPHVDLKRGQVQIIVALVPTRPTLVYDPGAPRPGAMKALEAVGLDALHARAPHLAPLLHGGGTALALPAEELYSRMVEACPRFEAGDAVQIRDGVVHAGPQCEDHWSGLPRIVVFSTYTTRPVAHYDVEQQYKLWDWASYPAVPAELAHARLREVHGFARERGMAIEPWRHYAGRQAVACRRLCTEDRLEAGEVQKLVATWRGET